MKNLMSVFNLFLLPFLWMTYTKNVSYENRQNATLGIFYRLFPSLIVVLTLLFPNHAKAADKYDASITISTTPTSFIYAGSELTYDINISSVDLKIKPNIVITNTFDTDFSFVGNTGTNWTCAKSNASVLCTFTDAILNNQSSDFTFTIIPVADGSSNSITNTAEITSVGNTDDDINPSNNSVTVTTDIVGVADLSIFKTDSQDPVVSNERYAYILNATNNGSFLAEDVQIIDAIPTDLVFYGAYGVNWSCTYNAGQVTCDYDGNLSTGEKTSDIIIDVAAPATGSSITNTAKVTSSTTDSNLTDNTTFETTSLVINNADLSILITDSPDPVITTNQLTYTLEITNFGPNAVSGVQVIDNLPDSVNFISVSDQNGGSIWSCSQGSNIVCNYVANGGILVSNLTTFITIVVTTPSTVGTIENNVTVSSTSPDPDLTNNTASATTDVVSGIVTGGERPFDKYLQYNLFGDMKHIGNANINKRASDADQNYNDSVYMEYVDTDGDATTYNSSSSILTLDSSYTIKWAGLYWEGHLCNSSTANECVYSNSTLTDYTDARSHIDTILFSTPTSAGYLNLPANNIDNIQFTDGNNRTHTKFSGFADVTSLVSQAGTYGVANIPLSEGQVSGGGNYGGWMLLVVYEDPSKQLHYKNISVFNGFEDVTTDDFTFNIDGFVTPLNGSINASVSFFAGDGDPAIGGVARMRVGNSTSYNPVGGDASNPTDNLLNGSIAEFGTPINSGVTQTYGVDADRVDVSPFMVNGQTDTTFKFDVKTPSGGVDHYTLSMFAFATDLTTPIINHFDKAADIIDKNGNILPAGPGVSIYPGTELIYTLTFKNTGDETAYLVEIFDDFDFDNLTPVFDLLNFDGSKIKLSVANSTTWQNNPDCSFNAAENRVSCRLNTVGIGDEYKMQFSVKVKDDISGYEDTNTTNTAYINYKNITTNEYLVLVSNEHGDFGGSSIAFDAGILTAASGGYQAVGMDAINVNYPYEIDRNITTKVVNQDFSLDLIYLDTSGNRLTYTGEFDMEIFLTLHVDENVSLIPNVSATTIPIFRNGDSQITATGLRISKAYRGEWVNMSYVNWNELNFSDAGINCVQKSTTSGNYAGLPQCLSSDKTIDELFTASLSPEESAYVRDVCLGANLNYGTPACNTNAYTGGVLKTPSDIQPIKYRHNYGCYHCLADGLDSKRRSTDDFSVRPDRFTLSTDDKNHFPDLLRSGADYNLTMHAVDGTNTDTVNYNQVKSNLDINQTLLLSTGNVDTLGLLDGNVTFSPWDFNISNGISVSPGSPSNEVVGYTFDNVADVVISFQDQDWASVDKDDTPQDCDTTVMSINGNIIPIEASAYICGEINTTFIPDHFQVGSINVHNHADGNFTYLSSKLGTMSAHVSVALSAMNQDNTITTNFRAGTGYYENPVRVDMNVTRLHPKDNDRLIRDIENALNLGFGTPDGNGSHTIKWDENDTTKQLLFNYDRKINQVVNPFDVNSSEINITVSSSYLGAALEGNATISGNGIGSGASDATFYYARVRPNKYFYEDIVSTSVNTPVAIDIYCDLGYAACSLAGIDTLNAQIDDSYWWLSLEHNTSRNDGDITIQEGDITEGSGAWYIGSNPALAKQAVFPVRGVDNNISVTRSNTATLPFTVEIDIDSSATSSWLIYNPDDSILPPSPLFKVRFIGGNAGWTGVGKTGNVLDTNTSTTPTKRMNW